MIGACPPSTGAKIGATRTHAPTSYIKPPRVYMLTGRLVFTAGIKIQSGDLYGIGA